MNEREGRGRSVKSASNARARDEGRAAWLSVIGNGEGR